jgi:hypothetical protein
MKIYRRKKSPSYYRVQGEVANYIVLPAEDNKTYVQWVWIVSNEFPAKDYTEIPIDSPSGQAVVVTLLTCTPAGQVSVGW